MNKKTLIIMVLMLTAFSLFAVNIDVVLESAKKNSSVYQGYEISRSNSQLNKQQKDLQGVSVSVSGGIKNTDKATLITPSKITVTVPDIGNDIKLTFDTGISQVSLREKSPFSITPSLNLSKTVEVKNFTDTRSEIEDTRSDLQPEVSYLTNVYNFENGVINALINIMQSETRIHNSEKSYKRALIAYEGDKMSGAIEDGSLKDIEQKMRLDSQKISLDSSKTAFEKSLADFKHQYGIDFQEITEIRDADLSFEISETGNSTVYMSWLAYQSAMQDLEAAQGYTNKLNIGGNAGTSINCNNDKKNDFSVDVGATVSYTASNWNVSMTVSDSFGKGLSMIPAITVSGSWSSNSTKAQSDDLNLQKLYNSVLEKENAYNNALYNYKTSAEDLLRSIETHGNDVA